jgi:hypothetical protein
MGDEVGVSAWKCCRSKVLRLGGLAVVAAGFPPHVVACFDGLCHLFRCLSFVSHHE